MKKIIQYFSPDSRTVSLKEKLLSAFLAFIATLFCIFISSYFLDVTNEPVYIASLGASAVLIFAAPSSPFSQPWALIGSHILCAAIGISCFQFVPQFILAAALAVGFSIFFMHVLKCLHPPGGALALSIVLGSAQVQEIGYQYILSPVLINVLMLFVFAVLMNNIVAGRTYPARVLEGLESKEQQLGIQMPLYNQEDLKIALSEMGSYIDISQSDLHRIYRLAVSHANERRIGTVACRDIMSKDVLTFDFSTELEKAWVSFHERDLEGAVVIDAFNRVVGVVTVRDFIRYADIKSHRQLYEGIKQFLKRTEGPISEKLEVVGQIMTSSVFVMDENEHIIRLLDVFVDHDFHHVPIVNEKKILVGMVNRTDLMKALSVLKTE